MELREKTEKTVVGTMTVTRRKGNEHHYTLFLLLAATKHKRIKDQTVNTDLPLLCRTVAV